MMDRRNVEEENMAALYEASRNGYVNTLNTLLQRDARILDRVSLTSFSETPLHLAALHGHLEFSILLVSKKPTLAKEVDPLGRTPLHLASAEGHTEIVKTLLQANKDICSAVDQDERIPLHLAAMRGRIEIIKELVIARPESIPVNLNGESVLHLCVRYNRLDALTLLVESSHGDELFLNSKDHDGNSILHLAVMLKQMKVIQYLLSVPEIKREVNALNKNRYTALDVLEVRARDFKYFEIKNILKEAGVKRSMDLNSSLTPALSGTSIVDEAQPARSLRECVQSLLDKCLSHQENWIEETRGTLMIVATVIATMAFQAGISPPGGVWQEDTKFVSAGTAVLSYTQPDNYLYFLYVNTTSFFASLCVILLVISGFSLRSKLFIWFLTFAMLTSVATMTLTYIKAVAMLTSINVYEKFYLLALKLANIWLIVVYIAFVIHVIRLIYWMVKKLNYIIWPLFWMEKKLRNFITKLTKGPAEDLANV